MTRNRIFYDAEFVDDGHTIDLVSIGLVNEAGGEYYAVSSEFDLEAFFRNPWLIENVWPTLPLLDDGEGLVFDIDHPDVKDRATIAREVKAFITQDPDPALWAWYGAYDHVTLAQLWGPMSALPDGIPMYTNDLKQECMRLGNPRMPEQTVGNHDALADARHNRVKAVFLDGIAAGSAR